MNDSVVITGLGECVFIGREAKMNNQTSPMNRPVRRGDIYIADLPEQEIGSIQSGKRPVLVTQCNRLNKNSTTVLVAMITSQLKRVNDECHCVLPLVKGLPKQSMVLAEQRKTISTSQLIEYRCTLSDEIMKDVTRALRLSEKSDNVRTYGRPYRKHNGKSNVRNEKSHKCINENK